MVVSGVWAPRAVVVAARVQVNVVVHRVHRDTEVVIRVVGLDEVVGKLLRLHDRRHAEAAAARVHLAVLVRPRLVKGVLRVWEVSQRVLVGHDVLVRHTRGGRVVADRVAVAHAAAAAGGALENLVVARGGHQRGQARVRHQRCIAHHAHHADVVVVVTAKRVEQADDVAGRHIRGELGVAVRVLGVGRRRQQHGGGVPLHQTRRGELGAVGGLRDGGGVRSDRLALAVVVAHRRVHVVVGLEALALGGDVVLAVLDVRHVQAPRVVLGEVAAGCHGGGVPLEVHAELLLQLFVLQLPPRVRLHQNAAVNVRVDVGGGARVVRRVSVAVVGVLEGLPPHVVLKLGRAVALGDDDLNRHAARPQRQ
mmetsp:Transcript_12545/g.38888  ORF Transcript_12545/g.38888 Transcript_12545/m.38888 type:complete len:365 (+) Transcript_12545:582-1676(+)